MVVGTAVERKTGNGWFTPKGGKPRTSQNDRACGCILAGCGCLWLIWMVAITYMVVKLYFFQPKPVGDASAGYKEVGHGLSGRETWIWSPLDRRLDSGTSQLCLPTRH